MSRADFRLGVALATQLTLAGCVTDPSPDGWLPTAREGLNSTEGGWVAVDCKSGQRCAEGELIAAKDQSLEVLTQGGLVEVQRVDIEEATLAAYHSQHGQLTLWMSLGTLSTVTHGWFAVITAPLWLITGTTAKEYERRAALRYYPDVSLAEFATFARFPQGRPLNVTPKSLGALRTRTAEEALSAHTASTALPTLPSAAETAPAAPHVLPSLTVGGTVKVRAGGMLRSRPKLSASSQPVSEMTPLELKASIKNSDGQWWYVATGTQRAWVLESDLELVDQ